MLQYERGSDSMTQPYGHGGAAMMQQHEYDWVCPSFGVLVPHMEAI